MDMKSLLTRDHLVINFKASGRREILRQVSQPLVANGVIIDHEQFLDDLERREDQITTHLQQGIAFPHARSEAVRRIGMAVGVAAAPGVIFNPDSNDPCRLFFLIAIPSFAPTAHMPLLQRLATFAHDHSRVEKLLSNLQPAVILRRLTSFKG